MGTQGTGRKRHPNRERLSAEDHALNQIAREAEARLAAKRAARAEAREIRMKELERQQKEIYQVQKKYYGLDAKWGDIEQWMEDSERYSHRPRRNLQVSDDDDLMSVTSRSSLRTNGCEDELLGPSQYRKSSRSSTGSGETFQSSQGAPRDEAMSAYYSDLSLSSAPLSSKQQQQSVHNGSRGSLYDEGVSNNSRRSSSSRPPSEYSCYLGSGSRASSRASSARASPVSSEPPGPSVYRRGSNSASVPSLSHLDDVSVPAMSRVEERSDKDFGEKGSRPVSSLSAATLASLGGTSSRRGSGDTSISVDTEASIREIKDSLAEVEEKYKRSMVTNAQLDNEKSSLQYQVDTLREVLLELEEELAESRRQHEEKHKECERQRHDQTVLRFQLAEMKEALEQRESLLTEIRQMQQKQQNSDHEICDLKETIEWKEKKIGALERQKEFFEPVRSERDTLREEVTRLRDELKKHGIVLDSVGTPNGDAALEPHANPDGRPDPPIRATSMGPSEEAVEKKETMSVVGEIPPSKPKQDNQEVLLTASSETPLNAELGDNMKEQNIQEIASNSNDDVGICKIASNSNDEVDTGGTFSGCQNLEHQGEGLPLDSESTSDENEIAMDECAPENLNTEVLEQDFSEVYREATFVQRESSPAESEVFQDALDTIIQSPCVTSPPSEKLAVSVSDFGNEDYNISKQDFNKEEDKYEVQSTSVESKSDPNNGALEMSECRDNTAIIKDDMSDLHTDSKDEQETSSHDSSQYVSEESTADEMPTTAVEHEKMCEEEVKPVESGLQCREDDSEITDSNANYTTPEKEIVSTETALHTDTHDVGEEKKIDITPEKSSQDIQLTKEEKQLVDSENNNFGEVPEPCIGKSTQSTVEDEPLRDSEVFEDSISHLDQLEDLADAGSLNADLESSDNGKMNTVFLNAPGAELLDKGEQDTFSDNLVNDQSEKTTFSDVPDTELLDEEKPGNMSDHPVCDMDEKTNPVLPDAPSTELLDGDHDKNTNDNVPVVAETSKETISSETLSSEGESTPEGEESDDNNDNEEDVAVRSEKYTGESLPLGSSVDQASADDIRMEDSLDKASRKGKGKNKEDCVVS